MNIKAFFKGFVQGVVGTSAVAAAAGVAYLVARDLMDRRSASAE